MLFRSSSAESRASKQPTDPIAATVMVIVAIGGVVVLAVSCCPAWLWIPGFLLAVLVAANSKVSFRWKVTRDRDRPPRNPEPDARRDQSGF